MNLKSIFFDYIVNTPFKRGLLLGVVIASAALLTITYVHQPNQPDNTKVTSAPTQNGAFSAMHPDTQIDTNSPTYQSGYSMGLSGQSDQVSAMASGSTSDRQYVAGYQAGQRDRILTQHNV